MPSAERAQAPGLCGRPALRQMKGRWAPPTAPKPSQAGQAQRPALPPRLVEKEPGRCPGGEESAASWLSRGANLHPALPHPQVTSQQSSPPTRRPGRHRPPLTRAPCSSKPAPRSGSRGRVLWPRSSGVLAAPTAQGHTAGSSHRAQRQGASRRPGRVFLVNPQSLLCPRTVSPGPALQTPTAQHGNQGA